MQNVINRWLNLACQLVKMLFFFLFLLSFLRILFLGFFWSQWVAAPMQEIMHTILYGFRINLKSAGLGVAIWFVFGGIPYLLFGNNKKQEKITKIIVYFQIGIFLFLGFATIPYFYYFNTGFNYLLFQGVNENWFDLGATVLANKSFFVLLFGFFIVYFGFCKLWVWWMKDSKKTRIESFKKSTKLVVSLLLVPSFILVAIFCRFGGSLTYGKSLHWENYAVVSNDLLNESILDGMQSSYRAWQQKKILDKNAKQSIQSAELKILLQELNSSPQFSEGQSSKISPYIYHQAKGERVSKPQHIFIILGESQGEWPLFSEYEKLHLADGMKSIIKRSDSVWVSGVLPNGPFTTMGLQSVVIGLANANQTPQFQKRSYEEVYETGLAVQMKKLGYKSQFWYGGPETWEEIGKFVEAQGFDDFYGMGRLNKTDKQSVWGISDQHLYEGIMEQFDGNESTVNVILTTSNHAPYQIDYIKEGFPIDEVKKRLTPEQQKNQRLLDQLGHYWYADREMTKFVEKMRLKYPDSLFVLTGDHGTRLNLENKPTLRKKIAIPVVISGKGIQKEFFPEENVTSQLQIIPTLIELIAPKGFGYYSLLPSMTEKNHQAINNEYWISNQIMGSRLNKQMNSPPDHSGSSGRNLKWEEAILSYSWWRVIKGDQL